MPVPSFWKQSLKRLMMLECVELQLYVDSANSLIRSSPHKKIIGIVGLDGEEIKNYVGLTVKRVIRHAGFAYIDIEESWDGFVINLVQADKVESYYNKDRRSPKDMEFSDDSRLRLFIGNSEINELLLNRFTVLDFIGRNCDEPQIIDFEGFVENIGGSPLDPLDVMSRYDFASKFNEVVSKEDDNKVLYDVLQDGKAVCGIGTVYTGEILMHSKLSPGKKIGSMEPIDFKRLTTSIVSVLSKHYINGGLINEINKDNYLAVAGSDCVHCSTKLEDYNGTRGATYWCEVCQKS